MRRLCLVSLIAAFLLSGCRNERVSQKTITLATTTSTQDTGLLDLLLPAFEKDSGVKVKAVAMGSGQALELGRRGDVDVLLTHAPEAEEEFMAEGWGASQLALMQNDFVVLGPVDDPAEIKGISTAADAFKRISESRSPFVSRGDDSGTHQKELSIWKETGIPPEGDWYIQAGTGMAGTLRMAHEKNAYILCDRATFLTLKQEIKLTLLVEGDERLLNHFSVITVSRAKHPHVQQEAADRFAQFLTSETGQKLIGDFGVDRFGQALFFPVAEQN